MNIHKASEDYLEAMLMMQEKHGYIRSLDVAEQLGVTKPSVSYATKRLREGGYITMNSDSHITLGVDEETARKDACKIEHDISEKTFEALCKHVGR